jgi:RES domain-containing protein
VRFYRIAKEAYISDMTGTGARIHGGRWNHKGSSVIYVSESRALATTEYLVHAPMSLLPSNLKLATIDVDKKASVKTIDIKSLPKNWRSSPAPSTLADIGNKWVYQNRSLLLRVPSVVVAGDFNALINPAHPEYKYVKIHSVVDYELDSRLLGMS